MIFNILHYMCRRGREKLRAMKQYMFAVSNDPVDGRKFVYQAVDEYDINHNETNTSIANEGRMYEIPTKIKLQYRKIVSSRVRCNLLNGHVKTHTLSLSNFLLICFIYRL